MGGVTGLLTNLIMVGVVLYVGVNFVLPLAQKAVSGGTGLLGDVRGAAGFSATTDDFGQDF